MKYAWKKIKDVIFVDPTTTEHRCTLNDLTSVKLSNGADEVNALGSDGAKLAVFDTKKTTQITLANGAIESGMITMQTGGTETVVSNGTGIRMRDIYTTTDGTNITLNHKISGKTGNEIKFIYSVDINGNPDKSYPQAATASTTAFAYAPDTKIVTLPTDAFATGTSVIVDTYPTFSEYKEIDNNSDNFSFVSTVIIRGWFTDLCSQSDVPLQIVCPRGKVSGKFDWEAGDKAAVQNVIIDALTLSCGTKNLWKAFNYDESKISDI